ncbi:MAG: APC family permease [Syntrophobacteraceae bacterium]|nr:APC family permease [Syntrophobacteraceae bacterium]
MDHKASVEEFGYKQELRRSLSVRDLVIFGMVFMSPISSMVLFGVMDVESHGHNFLSYLFGFTAMLFTAHSYGKMVEAFPIAGSTYSYTQRAISPKLGFMAGWVILLDYFLIPTLLYVISANFVHALIPQVPFWVWIVIYIIPVTIVNIMGVEVAAKINFGITVLMIAAVVAFVAAAFRYAMITHGYSVITPAAIYNPATFSWNAVVAGSSMAVLCYLGFDAITTLSEEADATSHKMGMAIIMACVIQTVLYLAIAYFGMIVAPAYTHLKDVDTVFFGMAFKVGGYALQVFTTLVIAMSGVATALAGQSAASRVLYGMGRDKMIPPEFFAYLHPKFKTPTYNILAMGIIGLIGSLTISMTHLGEMVTFGGLFGFICVNLSVIWHFYIKKKERRRSLLLYVVCPFIGMVVCAYILMDLSPLAKMVGFLWMGLGVLYLVIRSFLSTDFQHILEKSSLVDPDANFVE